MKNKGVLFAIAIVLGILCIYAANNDIRVPFSPSKRSVTQFDKDFEIWRIEWEKQRN